MTALSDQCIAAAEQPFADEYQVAQLHRSNTVGMYYTAMAVPWVAAIIAFCLDGRVASVSALVLLPLAAGELAGAQWLRRRVPRPKNAKLPWPYLLIYILGAIAWIAVMVWRIGDAFGALAGAILGATLTVTLAPKLRRRQHRRDVERLDAELDDD